MSESDRILSDFARAWEAGELPDPDAYLERVPVPERHAVSERLRSYMLIAPEPDYDEAGWQRLCDDPAALRAAAVVPGEPEPWPQLLPRLRQRAGVTWAEVASALGVSRPERAQAYLEAMERGDHEPRRVTARALEALARVLGVPADALAWRGPEPAPGLLRASGPQAPAPDLFGTLEVMADLATTDAQDWDDADLLFLGGRDLG